MGAVAPQQAPTTVTEAVETGQSPSKAIQTDVAKQIDEVSAGSTRGRPAGAKTLTPEQRSQQAGDYTTPVEPAAASPASTASLSP